MSSFPAARGLLSRDTCLTVAMTMKEGQVGREGGLSKQGAPVRQGQPLPLCRLWLWLESLAPWSCSLHGPGSGAY